MSILTSLRDRPSRDRRHGLRHVAHAAVPPLLVIALLGVLLPVGLGSTLGAAAAVGVTLGLIVLFMAGLEGTAKVMLFLGLFTASWNNVKPVAAASFVTVSDVFLVLGIGLLVPVLMRRTGSLPAPFLLGAGGLVAAGLISSALSVDAGASLNGLARLAVGALIVPVVFMLWRPGRGVVISYAAAYVVGNCVSIARGLATGVRSDEGRYIGFTEHPNILGLTSLLSLALIPFLYEALPKSYRWMVLGAAAVCGYGVWVSGSRAALVAAVGAVLLYLALSRSIEHMVLLFGLSIAPLYYVGTYFASGEVDSSPLGRLRGGGSATYSDIDRNNLTKAALDRFLSHPLLGTGFDGAAEAHNIFLQVAAAGGVLTLVFYLIVLIATIRQPLRLGRQNVLLALPALSYAMIGPLTPLIWDRYIWCVLALPFLMQAASRSTSDEPAPEPALGLAPDAPRTR